MALYASGKAAAIAAIKAQIDVFTKVLSDDTLALDWLSLQVWTGQQGLAIIANDVPPGNRDAATAVLNALDPTIQSQQLSNVYPRARWQGHPDWPTSGKISNSTGFLDATRAAIADAEEAGNAIDAHYTSVEDKVSTIVQEMSESLNLQSKLPPVRERNVSRVYYLYTYVTDWGEESAPSPVSDGLDVDQDDKVTITIDAAPTDRFLRDWRFYASSVGSTTAAFQFLGDGAVTITEGKADPKSPLGEVCPTATWAEPPPNLRGLVGMPNGVMAGFFDNVVCFCEPYIPYAWPVDYQLSTSHPVTAMAVFGQTLVVAHYGGVDYVSGADSASMSSQKDVSKQSCVSPRSMVAVDGGVVYASPDGLCLATSQGVQLITLAHFSREDWQALNPAAMIGAYHESTYYFTAPSLVIYALHLQSGKLTTVPASASAFFQDPITDGLYAANNTTVSSVFAGSGRRIGKWRSKIVVLPGQQPFAWLAVESDFTSPVTVKWYGDGQLCHTAVVTSRAPVRLPPGRYLEHEVEVISTATLNSVTLASSTQELQSA